MSRSENPGEERGLTQVTNPERCLLLVDGRPVSELDVADTYLRRLRGMLGKVRVRRPLLLRPCASVHGTGMLIPLDVAVLDEDLVVLHVTTLWPMGLVRPRRRAHSTLEAARGDLARWGIEPGTRLGVEPPVAPGEVGPGQDDHGAAALEWVGAITVAAVLIGTVASSVAFLGHGVHGGAQSAICRVLSLGQGECARPTITAGGGAPSDACDVPPGSAPGQLPVTRAQLATGDGRTWEKILTAGGAYRVSLRATGSGSTGPGSTGSLAVDAADGPVFLERGTDGQVELPAASTWLAPSGAAADGLVGAATTTQVEDAVLGATPARTAWDGLRSLLGSGTDDVGAPAETVVASGVVVDAADAATGVSSYASGSLGATRALGVRVGQDGQATVYLATAGASGTDVVSAVGVDSTGAPQNVGVTVLPARAGSATVDDPAILRAFGWDGAGQDGAGQDGAGSNGAPLALSARVALDGSAGNGALAAASSLLSAVGADQWAVDAPAGDALTGFARTARAEGTLSARTSGGIAEDPATGLQPGPGGIPMTWDTVARGPGDAAGFDGRSWRPAGPCG